jgi:D-tyrosyl-tRNA(Tyr) deacylase
MGAAPPDQAAPLVDYFADRLRARGFRVDTGRFGAMMDVELCNDGPVTIVLSTDGWT